MRTNREGVFISGTIAVWDHNGNWKECESIAGIGSATAELPVDRLARQVQLWLRAEPKPGQSAERLVAEAVVAILDATMNRVARDRGGAWGRKSDAEAWGDPSELGAAYEGLLMLRPQMAAGELEFRRHADGGHARRRGGVYYTPAWLVGLVLDAALEPVLEQMGEKELLKVRVLDPACGSGNFLVAAAERIARRLGKVRKVKEVREPEQQDAARCVYGIDRDPVAVALCRAAVWRPGANTDAQIIAGDGLLDDPPGSPFDVVIGNPPFLNRLEKRTALGGAPAAQLKARFGEAARAYTDISALFLLRGIQLVRKGGRAAMVQPQSILTSRDAAGVRREIMKLGTVTDIWLANEYHFDASVHVCVPTVTAVAAAQAPVRRRVGASLRALSPAVLDGPDSTPDSWGALGPSDSPQFEITATTQTIGDIAEVAADFRDEYYGLRGMVIEDADLGRRNRGPFPALITSGLVDPACCLWGASPCRFDKHRWESPRVDLARLKKETTLGTWAAARLRPKVVLATQTRVLEAAVDVRGEWLPVTPLISIVPRRDEDLWRIGAALTSPVVTALAMRISAGAALTRDAIKLSATQVRTLPLPPANQKAQQAADAYREACGVGDREALLLACAEASCRALGLNKAQTLELTTWWLARLRGKH